METTFTWRTPDGTEHQVEPIYDRDQWTGKEVRQIERLHGGAIAAGWFGTRSAVFAMAIARDVPGYTIARADEELTYGRVTAIWDEITTKERAEREAAAAAELEAAAEAPGEDVVLSPTQPGEPGDTQPSSE